MKVLVCAAWPYASGVPHLGNLVGSLLSADVFSRYHKIKGDDVLFVSGTDMHGTRIEYNAAKLGITPKELAFQTHEKIKQVLEDFSIELDNYSHTESETHKEYVKNVFIKLNENGYLFKKEEKKPYCNNCKRFLADRLIYGTCPHCGYEHAYGNQCEKCGRLLNPEDLIDPHCAFCNGKDISFVETENWYFDLPKLKTELTKFFEANKDKWPSDAIGMTKEMLKNLEPRAITRDIKWGIKFPLDESKVIYVWAEAALGYVSTTIELNKFEEFWKSDSKKIFCIGKDNIPFHTIFFPAQLLGLKENYDLNFQIASTEYLNWIENQKFSKSKGVGIFSDEAKKLMNTQLWRFYLLYSRPESRDVEFSWEELDKIVNKVLIENVINFIYRAMVLGNKIGYEGEIEDEVKEKVKTIKLEVEELFEKTLIGKALQKMCELPEFGNKYLQSKEPWKTKDKNAVKNALYIAKASAIMLYPFIPKISEKIANAMGFKISWGEIENEEVNVVKVEKIAEKVDVEKVKKMYEEMKSKSFATIEDFQKLGLKVGKIIDCERVEGSDKLLKIKVDIGNEVRQVIAGLGKFYEPKELIDKMVVVATNLKPRKIFGLMSEGMILGTDSGKILEVEGKPGESIR